MCTLQEAAKSLNVPLELLCRLARAGLLPVFKVDGKVKVRVDDVADIVENDLRPAAEMPFDRIHWR